MTFVFFFVKESFCKTLSVIYTLLICLFLDEKKLCLLLIIWLLCFHDINEENPYAICWFIYRSQRSYKYSNITLSSDTEVVKVCLNCVYNALLSRKFDKSCINDSSRYETYYAYSSYYKRICGTAKTCLESIKSWIHHSAETFKKKFNGNVIMKSCCVQCFRKSVSIQS